jgi:hypothetical protein
MAGLLDAAAGELRTLDRVWVGACLRGGGDRLHGRAGHCSALATM